MDGMETSIVLVVKAPNQQIEDQMVHCELSWTIRKLKDYLSEVYPSKPRLEDQKLIYSGQLLSDTVILKDVLRTYEGQKNHTLHLVCLPSHDFAKPKQNESATTVSAQTNEGESVRTDHNSGISNPATSVTTPPESQDGLRHRGGHNMYADTRPAWADPRSMWGGYTEAQTPWPVPPTYDPAYVAQQMAWMQQAYAQYMSQYMQLISSGSSPPVTNSSTTSTTSASPAPVQPAAPPPAPAGEEAVAPNNVVRNGEADEEEIRVNRDWLEWFYILSRVLVLFSIVYFYSSPIRFFLVSTLGVIMYLYHLGFFRQVQPDRPEPQVEVPPVPVAGVDNNNIEPTPDPVPPEPDRPSILALTWSVFCSFFLSLIPDQPNNIL